MKSVSKFLVSPITFIINNFNRINQFPDISKLARISLIPKIQLPVELKDYRPVSILPVLSKIYGRVVLEQITNFIEKNIVYITIINLAIARIIQLQHCLPNYEMTSEKQ